MERDPTNGNGEPVGGPGGVREDGPLRRRIAMTMERRALRENWPMPPAKLREVVARQVAIATNRAGSNREATMAFRALLEGESAWLASRLVISRHGD